MKAVSMHNDMAVVFFINIDADTHLPETVDGGNAVGAGEEICDFRISLGNASEHHCAVRDGFVPRNVQSSFQWFAAGMKFHMYIPRMDFINQIFFFTM
jgi:hypothetical protein